MNVSDHAAHLVRARHREPDAVPGATQGSATGGVRPVLRLGAAVVAATGRLCAASAGTATRCTRRPSQTASTAARTSR